MPTNSTASQESALLGMTVQEALEYPLVLFDDRRSSNDFALIEQLNIPDWSGWNGLRCNFL